MRILDELRYLRDLFVKNTRRLLHLLSTNASKARADITKLLHKYYTLVFADAPARVHQVMVDFNRWLADVLEDTHSEGIEWGPSYGENPWLALVEPQPQDDPLHESFNAVDVRTFRAACEYYMARCEGLQETNADLTAQLEELKAKLKEALVRAFESQQTLEREREVAMLHAQRLVMGVQIGDHLSQQNSHGRLPTSLHQQITEAFQMLNMLSTAPREGTETESTSVSEWGLDANDVEAEESQAKEPECTEDVEAAPADKEQRLHLSRHEEDNILLEGQEAAPFALVQTRVDDPDLPPGIVFESTAKPDGCDYQQLTELRASEETSGSWYRHALRSLKEKREQRRLQRKTRVESVEAPIETFSMGIDPMKASSGDAQEFMQLVSIRDTAEDGEDSTWYRRALQHLKDERKRRVSLRDRDSFSSTISIVD
ncbi:hypothetical protein PC129_g19536 [Phytophthora cactorum]|uniref:Uncharacterized protein n=1 Tax=Phytophthora cactorum TaxID=29920 RepID=A0A329RTW5_9STRA|nr:hypothetical protein Pcac1_g23715 [Phytophthora cactorum]KAG2806178.1 hypothetical protein PC112_g17950 [Phytophthora cactorum]KAG2812435.1 hypothetical protein PC111_g14810 [Phytophthora cactorum]KAG2837365.1 hypothetical protein PC113_g19850 [Phytophthora cactorum]KAG2888982.1 hypothetical protein PC115_g19892 [Phytophthora cactorum]